MQVDRQPSPWPSVAILAGLLFLCLMAPRYWQNTVMLEDPAIGAEREVAYGAPGRSQNPSTNEYFPNFYGGIFNFSGINIAGLTGGSSSDIADLNLCPPTPIEDLIAANVARAGNSTGDGFDWPVSVRGACEAARDESPAGPVLTLTERPSPSFALPFRYVGGLVSEYSSASAVSAFATQFPNDLPRWVLGLGEGADFLLAMLPASEAVTPLQSGPSMVRVSGPNDRLAMMPEPRESTGPHPWCVPQTLLDELDRLAGQPESAQWASQVRNQLHALTDREQLAGDDVQLILADLSGAAQEAVRMADEFDNDRLRVELLRVHWGLARRLDCWGAMHEKRVAAHFQSRVAARGSLNPYLQGSSDGTTVVPEIVALSNDLEKYESSRDPKLGRCIALQQQSLKNSTDTMDHAVAESVEQHYRNANVRIAITAEMLNRLAGVERNEWQPVDSRIAGAHVRGESNVRSESRVVLDPSANEWQIQVQANGEVNSNTVANGGPVRLRSRGTTDFSASKSVVVNDRGVHLKQSNVNAMNRSRLVGVTTDYDWMPLFGDIARERAIGEYRTRQGMARAQIESRVATEASETLDQHTREAVDQIRQQTYDRFASELEAFDIKVIPVEMTTTTDRLVARLRIAGDKQLGSHTPRPRALSDSLASAQVHETAMTNLAVTLGLNGKRFTAPELRNMLRERFPQLATKNPTEAKQETVFQFANEDAVQVRINDGKLELRISFASIELQHDVMPEVVVHAQYVPKVDGLNAELVREGTLGIEGRISSGDRARLHNVFNRVLPPERHLPVLTVDQPIDKRFQGLMITQLVLEDGWMGLAVGPVTEARVAERSRSLR